MLNDIETSDSGGGEADLLWGGEAIAHAINRTPQQFYYLWSIGALNGAVRKVGHRTFVGSRRRLCELILDPK